MTAIVHNSPVSHRRVFRTMVSQDLPTTPLPLIFGPYDPSGASNLPVDTVICAMLGAHAGSVVTSIHVQDTAHLESVERMAPELIDDQGRCLLEDMAIGALKIGPQYDPEAIAMLAQIAADYSTLPLVLHLSLPPAVPDLEDLDAEDTLAALLELLVPQACVVVLDAELPDQLAGLGLLSGQHARTPIEALHEMGVSHVLCSNRMSGPELNGLSLHSRGQPSKRRAWPLLKVRAGDSESLLATVTSCLLAQGVAPVEAIALAASRSATLLERHFHPGMGQRLLLHVAP